VITSRRIRKKPLVCLVGKNALRNLVRKLEEKKLFMHVAVHRSMILKVLLNEQNVWAWNVLNWLKADRGSKTVCNKQETPGSRKKAENVSTDWEALRFSTGRSPTETSR
jgi:hypothetical protein